MDVRLLRLKRFTALLMGLLLIISGLWHGDTIQVRAAGITVTTSGVEAVEFKTSDDADFHGADNLVPGTYSIRVSIMFTMEFSSLKIKVGEAETDYSADAAASHDDIYTVTGVVINDGDNVSITATSQQSSKRTIIWTYDPSEDDSGELLVEHGRVEVISGATDFNSTEAFKHYIGYEGDVVTVKLIPDAGYQIAGASINGTAIAADDGTQSQFSFTLGSGHVRFKGAFTKVSPQTAVKSSSNVTAMTASVPDSNISTGSVAVIATGGQTSPSDADIQTAMGSDGNDFVSTVETVNIGITNIVSKGGSGDYANSANNYWVDHNVTELISSAQVFLSVPSSGLSAGETYSVIREHAGDNATEIDATYNSASGQLRFNSDKFSNYTIIKKKGTPETSSDTAYNKAKESSTSSQNDEADKEEKPDFTDILKSYDGAASGLSFDNSASTSDGQTHKVSLNITSTGENAIPASARNAMPSGFKGAFGFNILIDGKPATGNKSGDLVVNVPMYYQRNNRVFGLIITDSQGKSVVYMDEDLNSGTFTANINTAGYSCELIYIDTTLDLISVSGINDERTVVVGQGPLWRAAVASAIPVGYRPLFCFNLLSVSGRINQAPGTVSIRIPSWSQRAGRTYALIGVDKSGLPHIYQDTDKTADTLTTNVPDIVPSFALIYTD